MGGDASEIAAATFQGTNEWPLKQDEPAAAAGKVAGSLRRKPIPLLGARLASVLQRWRKEGRKRGREGERAR
eukprot:1111430-Rhodomonas_salina.1